MKFSNIVIGLGALASLALATAAFAGPMQHGTMNNAGQHQMMNSNCPNMNEDGTMKNRHNMQSGHYRDGMSKQGQHNRSDNHHYLIEGNNR
ncbi:MAG: hypothetical protein ACK5JO_10715 [Halodesulfovibrio sp.]